MKNKDKKQNPMCQDNMPDIIEIPLKKLHKHIGFIRKADLEAVNIILTHKGKWKYSLMNEVQYAMLIDTPDPYEYDDKDPRLDMLPTNIQAVPLPLLLECMLDFGGGLIDLGSEYTRAVSHLVECGGEKI